MGQFDFTTGVTPNWQIDGTLTVGADGAGHDVTFYGDTAGAKFLWDADTDTLILSGGGSLNVGSGGAVTLSSPVIMNSSLGVAGAATFGAPVTMSSSLGIAGTLTGVAGTFSGGLGVAGLTQLQQTLIYSSLGVAGLASFNSIFLTGNMAVGGTVDGVDVSNHSARHEDDGADEVSLTGLSGDPADTINESLLTTQNDIIVRGASEAGRLNITASKIVARLASGNIVAATPAQIMALLSGQAGAAFSMNSNKITSLATPAASTDATTKEYVDAAVASMVWEYFLNDTASGADSYYTMSQTATGDVESSFTTASLGQGDAQALTEWISDAAVPFLVIRKGQLDFHIHAERTVGNRSVVIYAELYEYKTDTSEVLIATTEDSSAITDKVGVGLHATLANDYTLTAGSKLLVKYLADLGAGAPTTIVLYAEGTLASSVNVSVLSSSFDDVYIRQSLYDANTILAATSDDTPVAVTVAEQRIIGRQTSGNIAALTGANALLAMGIGATIAEIDLLDLAGMATGSLLVATAAGTAVWQSTGVTLTAPNIDGTVTNTGATLVMPAFTAGGDIIGQATYDLGSAASPFAEAYVGNTNDYFKVAIVGNIPTLYGTGAYLRVGDAGTAGHISGEDALLVTGALEVDGAGWFDSGLTTAGLALTGVVTGNSNTVNALGRIGLAGSAAHARHIISFVADHTITSDLGYTGISYTIKGAKTSAPYANQVIGFLTVADLAAANTQNWTVPATVGGGLLGANIRVRTIAGSSGTLTAAVGARLSADFPNAATVTDFNAIRILAPTVAGNKLINLYGIYMENMNTASTLNYAIKLNGGAVDLALPEADPEVAGQLWSNGGVVTVSAGA